MKITRMLALSAVAFAASTSASLAGPCSAEIDAMMAHFNAELYAKAGGSTAKEQAVVGGRHVQPTPRSMAAAEEKLGASPLAASLFVCVEHAFSGVHNSCFRMGHAILHQILRLFLDDGGIDDAIVAYAATLK